MLRIWSVLATLFKCRMAGYIYSGDSYELPRKVVDEFMDVN